MNEKRMSTELQQKQRVKLLRELPAPGKGLGKISYDAFEQKSNLAQEMIAATRELIQSSECMKTCNHRDDGCIDGRCVDEIAVPDGETFSVKTVEDNVGNERAKVAGGGLLTSLAMYKAIGEDLVSPDEDLAYIAKEFARGGVYCGAHTGSHGSSSKKTTDCGANDRFDEILLTAVKNREDISEVTQALLAPLHQQPYQPTVLNKDMGNWRHIVMETNNFARSNGISRLDVIRDGILTAQETLQGDEKASVIKHLGGDHNEIFLVVNYARGMTFSQTQLRQQMTEKFSTVDPDSLPQVFALDMWRVDELAHAIACLPEKYSGRNRTTMEQQERYERALHAGAAYQVATYMTLTDGSLPVFVLGPTE